RNRVSTSSHRRPRKTSRSSHVEVATGRAPLSRRRAFGDGHDVSQGDAICTTSVDAVATTWHGRGMNTAADAPSDRRGGRRNTSGLTRDSASLDLLGEAEAFRNGGLGVSRIAQRSGRDKAVVSRALSTLAEAGLVERDETTLAYRLGARLYALASRTAEATLAQTSQTALRRIARATRETTHLCVLR